MSEKFLIFDIGASSGRAIIGILENDSFRLEEIHRFDNKPVFAGGELFWDILYLLHEIKVGIQICEKKYGHVKSLAIDTWGCDFGLLDNKGRLIGNPVHYRDRKRHMLSGKLHEIISEKELFTLSGGPCDRIMSVYELFSLKHENAVEYVNANRFMMVPDLLNFFLTGNISNEFTNATMSLMCNQNTRQWEDKIISSLGFPRDIFTHIIEPGQKLGCLSNAVCNELGINPISVIVPATHDTASAIAGIPIVNSNKAWAFVSLGTWCISGVETPFPIINDKVISAGFGNEGGVQGKNMLVKNITGLWIIQQCRDKWINDAEKKIPWDDIVSAAKCAGITNVFIDVDDERFGKVDPDMPKRIADYCIETHQRVPETIGDIARIVYSSLAMKFKHNLLTIEKLTGKKLELLHLVGGGTQNKLLCQWTADAVGLPVIAGPTETTSVGNLIFQFEAAGYVNNISEGRKLCESSFETILYESCNTNMWNEMYQNYLKLQKRCLL